MLTIKDFASKPSNDMIEDEEVESRKQMKQTITSPASIKSPAANIRDEEEKELTIKSPASVVFKGEELSQKDEENKGDKLTKKSPAFIPTNNENIKNDSSLEQSSKPSRGISSSQNTKVKEQNHINNLFKTAFKNHNQEGLIKSFQPQTFVNLLRIYQKDGIEPLKEKRIKQKKNVREDYDKILNHLKEVDDLDKKRI